MARVMVSRSPSHPAQRRANTRLALFGPAGLAAQVRGAAAVGLHGRGTAQRRVAQTGRAAVGLAGTSQPSGVLTAFTYVTVSRDYDLADGEEPSGGLYFTPSDWMVNGGVTIVPAERFAPLDVDGIAAITLAANTDPATVPTGTTYTVREVIKGQPERIYEIVVPHNLGPAVSLNDL